MKSRNQDLEQLRITILNAKVNDAMHADECFQNNTLRPIIKFQNDLIIEVFRSYIKKRKSVFYTLSLEKRIEYIKKSLQKDTKLQYLLKGLVVGLFTVNEYLEYTNNTSALNKRIMSLIKERLISHLQLFQNPDQPVL